MKDEFTLIYHSEQKRHFPSRERVAYLLKAARSRGGSQRPRRMPSADLLLPYVATLFRHTAANPRQDPEDYYLKRLETEA